MKLDKEQRILALFAYEKPEIYPMFHTPKYLKPGNWICKECALIQMPEALWQYAQLETKEQRIICISRNHFPYIATARYVWKQLSSIKAYERLLR